MLITFRIFIFSRVNQNSLILKDPKGSKLYDDEENEVEVERYAWVPTKLAEVTKDPDESDEF